jgi:lysozyme
VVRATWEHLDQTSGDANPSEPQLGTVLYMEIVVDVIAIALSLILLWTGFRKLELSRLHKTTLWILDLALLVMATISRGWLGLWVFLGVNVVAILVWSIRLAMQKETLLTFAATQSGRTKQEMEDLYKRLHRSHQAFRVLGPIRLAELISQLAQRGRDTGEIEEMALPVAMLSTVNNVGLGWMAERVDRILRLYGDPASESMRIADTLTRATQLSAITFEEMVDATIAAVASDGPGRPYHGLESAFTAGGNEGELSSPLSHRRWPWVLGIVLAGGVGIAVALLWFMWLPQYRPPLQEGEEYGIDVSHHQGSIDWRRVAADDISFAYIKATEGGDFTDDRFEENWKKAADAGLTRGAYHFFTLCTPGDIQARHFLSVVPKDPEALPPAVDLELTGNCSDRPAVATVRLQLGEFLRLLESETGQRVILYVSDDFEALYPVRQQLGRPLWHLRFLLRPNVEGWVIWQVMGFAHIEGIDGDVDLDVIRLS